MLLPTFRHLLLTYIKRKRPIVVLDPFAGVGRIHELRKFPEFQTWGIEIEPEWSTLTKHTVTGDALRARSYFDFEFDAIVTSPTYGNRMADHHNAKDGSLRRSYFHDKGAPLHPNNSGQLHWWNDRRGNPYREFHEAAWTEVVKVLRPGGIFLLNCKDHIRGGKRQKVCAWHLRTLRYLGLERLESVPVKTPSMRAGENRELRLTEYVYVLRKT